MQVITKEDFQSIKPEKPTPVKQEVPPPPPPPQNVQKTGKSNNRHVHKARHAGIC